MKSVHNTLDKGYLKINIMAFSQSFGFLLAKTELPNFPLLQKLLKRITARLKLCGEKDGRYGWRRLIQM